MAPFGVLAFLAAFATANGNFIRQSDLPHDRWVSLQRNVEFLPVMDGFDGRRHLKTTTSTFYAVQPFVEGESDYNEYQQAWRYLGFMVDCNDGMTNDDDGGSWDGGTGEGCHRYVLWAAVSYSCSCQSL